MTPGRGARMLEAEKNGRAATMTRIQSSLPRTYVVAQSETYICKYCGDAIALARYSFHRCR
ncbi:MAG: hypothetical protein U0531_14900 [Dehalococcoidia bacterium]